MKRLHAVALALALAAASCAETPAPPASLLNGTVVDLSHEYSDRSIFWPTAETFKLEKVADGVTPQGYYYAANNFESAEHGGTHVDAPVHFAQGKWSVDQIPVEQMMGDAAVVDVSAAAATQPDHQVTVADLEAWEKAHGSLNGTIVLIRTDYSKRWPDAAKYLGTAERGEGAVPKLHFPGLHPDAAKWLVANRTVKAVGIDTASLDYGQSTMFETHRVLYERNIPGLENLSNLERLPARGATVIALPMKIKGGSGAPLRAIAVVQ
ncbi:MAG TPA: cyclase family protein [Vicinamibacterales bacterium]|nr:cyclase family protein [Vicinamibacterales bacterium]